MLTGIPVLFIIATPLHFLYNWTGKNKVVGLLTPVNESPWEHLKLTFWSMLVWWVIGYLRFGIKEENVFPSYVVSCAVAEIVCILFIIAFYYTYTSVFGIESLILDILSLLFGLISGILLAIHVYKYSKPGDIATIISIGFLADIFICYTYCPPHIPLLSFEETLLFGKILV
jgi:hypothetical protein